MKTLQSKTFILLKKSDFVKLLIRFQDECGFDANVIATQVIKDYNLEKEHSKLTGNPIESYK